MHAIDRLLLRATRQGLVEWDFLRDVLPPMRTVASFGQPDVVGEPLVCRWKDRHFRLYEHRYKTWLDEDHYEWANGVALELVAQPWSELEADLSTEASGWELLQAARNQAAQVNNVADTLRKALGDIADHDDEHSKSERSIKGK